jgi:hypothetical protein
MSVNRDDLVRLKSRLITEGMLLATAKRKTQRLRGARMLREAADCEETLAAMASDGDRPSRSDHISSAASCRRMANRAEGSGEQ